MILVFVEKINCFIVIDEVNLRCSIVIDIVVIVVDKGFDLLDVFIK